MFKVFESISNVDRSAFERVCKLSGLGSWSYYETLEKSGSLSSANGWKPQYLFSPDVFIPLFLKSNSADDFSYDQTVIEAFERETQAKYYPKLQMCIPFVPLEGSKFFLTDASQKKETVDQILRWGSAQHASSLHITLPSESEYDLLKQYHFQESQQAICYWQNNHYSSFGDFLGSLKSKYRSQISQERKTIRDQKYESFHVAGDQIQKNHVDQFYDLFEETHRRKGWVMSFLTRNFFHRFVQSNPNQVVFAFIEKENKIIAASCCFLEGNLLCGRFWGSVTDDHFLHFEIMYYLPMEFCIQQKISAMEIGFEKPHKVIRGFVPKKVKTFHYFYDDHFRMNSEIYFPSKDFSTKNVYR